MSKLKSMSAGCAFIVVLVLVMGFIGEFRCIYKFFTSDFEPSYKREVIYGVSALVGVGSITGWVDIEDTKPAAVPVNIVTPASDSARAN